MFIWMLKMMYCLLDKEILSHTIDKPSEISTLLMLPAGYTH